MINPDCYVVVRRYGILNTSASTHCVAVCKTLLAADEKKEAYEQEYLDRNIKGFTFEIQLVTYYDE